MNHHRWSENINQHTMEEYSSIGTPWILVAILESSEPDKEYLHRVDRVVDEPRDEPFLSQALFKHERCSNLQIMCIVKSSPGNSQYVDCDKTKNKIYYEETRYKVIRIEASRWKRFRPLARSIYSIHMLKQLFLQPRLDFTKSDCQ